MLLLNRVIYKDSAVLTDYSRELSDYYVGGVALVFDPLNDALYIGSDLPFNHRYFSMSALNAVAGEVSVGIWNGTSFVPAVDVIDLTNVGGKPFAKDGLIMWATDRSEGWAQVPTTEDIPELASLKIYNAYWVKLTFSAALSQTFRYVGHKFAQDSDLRAYYGDLDRATVREAFYEDPAVANYNSVHIAAAEEIVRDLRAQGIIRSVNQMFDPDLFRDAACHKAAEIIYSTFGPSHTDRVTYAVRKYKEAINKFAFNVDENADGRLEQEEKSGSYRMHRR